jgi:hypothetical protein
VPGLAAGLGEPVADADGDGVDVLGGGGRLHPVEVVAALDPVGGGGQRPGSPGHGLAVRAGEDGRRRPAGGDLVGLAGPADGHHRAGPGQRAGEGGGDQGREQADAAVGPAPEPLGAEQQRRPRAQAGGGAADDLEHPVGADRDRDQVGALQGPGQAAGVAELDPRVGGDAGARVGTAGAQLGQDVVVQPGPPEPHPVAGGHGRGGQGAAHRPGAQDGHGGHGQPPGPGPAVTGG